MSIEKKAIEVVVSMPVVLEKKSKIDAGFDRKNSIRAGKTGVLNWILFIATMSLAIYYFELYYPTSKKSMVLVFIVAYICYLVILDQYVVYYKEVSIDSIKKHVAPYDRIAIDHCLISVHLYQQSVNKEELDLKKATTRQFPKLVDTLLGPITSNHLEVPDHLLDQWEFAPFYGKTGAKEWLHGACYQSSLLGVIGICRKEKILSIAFRGSRRGIDWLNNFNLGIKKCLNLSYEGYVHAGYYNIFIGSRKNIEQTLKKVLDNIKNPQEWRFIVSGHSLGGALAIFQAAYMIANPRYKAYCSPENLELVTFGAPYVGIKYEGCNFAEWLESKLTHIRRYERYTDMAPYVSHIAKGRWEKNMKIPYLTPTAKPVGVGKLIMLPHFGKSKFQFTQAHDPRLYRLAIYLATEHAYEPLYTR